MERRVTLKAGGARTPQLRVIILKPSKYMADGYVERFRWGLSAFYRLDFAILRHDETSGSVESRQWCAPRPR